MHSIRENDIKVYQIPRMILKLIIFLEINDDLFHR